FEWNVNSVNNHAPSNIWKVEFLAVVRAKKMMQFVEMGFQKCFKILQNFHLSTVKTCYAKIPNIAFQHKIAYGDTDNFSKLCPNSGTFVEVFGRYFIFSLILAFQLP